MAPAGGGAGFVAHRGGESARARSSSSAALLSLARRALGPSVAPGRERGLGGSDGRERIFGGRGGGARDDLAADRIAALEGRAALRGDCFLPPIDSFTSYMAYLLTSRGFRQG